MTPVRLLARDDTSSMLRCCSWMIPRNNAQFARLVACCGTLADRPQLPCNNLRLPFRIEGHRQDCSTPITKKLEDRNCSFRDLVTGSKCFNDDIGYCIALWTLAVHICLRAGREASGKVVPTTLVSDLCQRKWPPNKGRPRARALTCQRQVASGGFDSANSDLAGAAVFLRVK